MTDETQQARPRPDSDNNSDTNGSDGDTNPKTGLQRSGPPEDDGQDYIDRSTIDFDPDEGLLSGTAIDGDTDIPGPHERAEDGQSEQEGDDAPDREDSQQ